MLNRLVENYLSTAKGLPFFYAVSDETYGTVLDDLKQAGLKVIRISDFCKKSDKFPNLDDLIDSFRMADVDFTSNKCVLVGLGEYLALRGEDEALKILRSLKYTTLGIARVVILLRYLHNQLHIIADEDLKLKSSQRVYWDSGANGVTSLVNVQVNTNLGLVHGEGIKWLLSQFEEGVNGKIYFKSDLDFSKSILPINTIAHSYDAITQIIRDFPLPRILGNDLYWDKLLIEIQKSNNITHVLGISDDLEYTFSEKAFGLEYNNWKYFLALKLNIANIKNPYLRYVLLKQNDFDSFAKNIVNSIIGISHDDQDFHDLYYGRKKLLSDMSSTDELLTDFIQENEIDSAESIYKLTDNTLAECHAIIRWVAQYGTIPELEYIYPALASYLKLYTFNCGSVSKELTYYFDEYKHQKVSNKISESFVNNASTVSYKYALLDTRENIFAKIDDKENTFLNWIDALGVEYLSYIVELSKNMGLSIHIDIARANLPSITSMNKAFYDNWGGKKRKESRLDEIKHKDEGGFDYSICQYPIHLADELEVISEALKHAKSSLTQHKFKKYIIASDHGASRLAVISHIEEKYDTDTKGEHSGRCCKFFEGCNVPNSITENGYIVLTDYGRFRKSRAANVEVHGGASLEETVIPIITLSLNNSREIEIKLLNPDNIIVERKVGVRFSLYISEVDSSDKVRVIYQDESYKATQRDETHFDFLISEIKRSGNYTVDVLDGDNLIGQVSLKVKGAVGSSKNDFDTLF